MITIRSLQIGSIRTEGDPRSKSLTERQWTTGFYKQPTTSAVAIDSWGIAGDAVADTTNHGGVDKAVLCYSYANYDRWNREYPDLRMTGGALGENLTLDGADETTVCIGDRYVIGDVIVEVSQPRQPCWKISRRWRLEALAKEVARTGRTGWYVRVITGGEIRAGDKLELIAKPQKLWTVQRANDILFGRESDPQRIAELVGVAELAESWKQSISARDR